ncbi:hypothetical protein AGR4A_pAt10240 [Agrobacterium tumefaciens str. B6]|uniref:Uncharacterized protein n=1 Tax=Agrobacterium tumefaciens str. B6 TaxID=1183423 RepID=A0A822VCN7_AGRTU|nr:hypothetical protein AGR4A_pAt10240 [Agrobacterium tumefaciens str. B6]
MPLKFFDALPRINGFFQQSLIIYPQMSDLTQFVARKLCINFGERKRGAGALRYRGARRRSFKP